MFIGRSSKVVSNKLSGEEDISYIYTYKFNSTSELIIANRSEGSLVTFHVTGGRCDVISYHYPLALLTDMRDYLNDRFNSVSVDFWVDRLGNRISLCVPHIAHMDHPKGRMFNLVIKYRDHAK